MAASIPAVFAECKRRNLTALVLISHDRLTNGAFEIAHWAVEGKTAYQLSVDAMSAMGHLVLPHRLGKMNAQEDGYIPSRFSRNFLYPRANALATLTNRSLDLAPPNFVPILELRDEFQEAAPTGSVEYYNSTVSWHLPKDDGAYQPFKDHLEARVNYLNTINPRGQRLAVRHIATGLVVEPEQLIGTSRTVADLLHDLARHASCNDEKDLFETKYGCVIFIASDPHQFVQAEQRYVKNLTAKDGRPVGYSYLVSEHLPPPYPCDHVNEILTRNDQVDDLLRAMAEYSPEA